MLRFIAVHVIPAKWLFFTRPGQAYLSFMYRYWCPGSNLSARECNRRGECGCDNAERYRDPRIEEMKRISDNFGVGPILRYGEDRYGRPQ